MGAVTYPLKFFLKMLKNYSIIIEQYEIPVCHRTVQLARVEHLVMSGWE
ncbi:Uncharacterised protein [Providencia stuartii]|nr:Uncharacterised protein [Providencia stuartii]